MEEQQYMLRCKDFYERIGVSIQNIIKQEEFIDVTIACDGKLFKAHKMILSACSPYFKKILQAIPCQHPVIFLQNVEEKHMKNILTFIYHGEVNIDLNSLDAFLKTAKFLQVEGLAEIENTWEAEREVKEEAYVETDYEPESPKPIKTEPIFTPSPSYSHDNEPPSPQADKPQNISQIIQPIACPICKIQQKNKYFLRVHLIKHHGEAGKPYLRFFVPTPPKPVAVAPIEFCCPFCNEKYHTKRDMNAHILTVHQKENYSDMKCTICDKVFSSVSNRNQHVLRYHAKVLD